MLRLSASRVRCAAICSCVRCRPPCCICAMCAAACVGRFESGPFFRLNTKDDTTQDNTTNRHSAIVSDVHAKPEGRCRVESRGACGSERVGWASRAQHRTRRQTVQDRESRWPSLLAPPRAPASWTCLCRVASVGATLASEPQLKNGWPSNESLGHSATHDSTQSDRHSEQSGAQLQRRRLKHRSMSQLTDGG